MRCYDTTSLTTETITLDTDPAILESMSEDTSECYTQVVLRGRDDVQPAYLSLHDGTLIGEASSGGGWTPADQAAWVINDYTYPQGGYDQGTITALSAGSCTIQSDNAAIHWTTNYWSGIQGQIAAINPLGGGGITFQEYRHVTACGAMSAGGTCSVTFDSSLASSGYTRYQLTGIPDGLDLVWRKFTINSSFVAQHLVQQFNFGVPFSTNNSAVALTTGPAGVVCFNAGGGGAGIQVQIPFNFEVVPYDGTTDGYIIAFYPVVQTPMNQAASVLNTPGAAVPPEDIIVLVPYSRGTLSVQSPSGGGYSGTAYTLFGVERTLYRDYPTWIDANDSSNISTLANNILATVSNAVQEGSITYLGKYTNALIGGSFPIALNVAKSTGTTGYESMAAPCRTVTLEWPQSNEAGSLWVTRLSFSTRRQQYSGDRLYVHPTYASGSPFAMGGGIIGAGFSVNGVEVQQSASSSAPAGTLQNQQAIAAAGPSPESSYDQAQASQTQQAKDYDAQQRQAKGMSGDDDQ